MRAPLSSLGPPPGAVGPNEISSPLPRSDSLGFFLHSLGCRRAVYWSAGHSERVALYVIVVLMCSWWVGRGELVESSNSTILDPGFLMIAIKSKWCCLIILEEWFIAARINVEMESFFTVKFISETFSDFKDT